ncbi:trace amine-associated receptor 8c-like isoform X1 [Takifugu rubripes]|uniref:trace amine-associated receptor 8c-like isoform X1 n=1 Tax=Takifugu rubripes TaxID=31033 RepID=UPI001145F7E5|nr:trace amine-associated receptor 8c-like isoform X1 [Takifugu rubripes]
MATSLHSTPPADSCLMLGNPLSSVQLWHFQTTTNIILLSMAVSDLLVSLAMMPLMIVTLDSYIIITFSGPLTVIIVLYTRVFVVAVTQARAMRSQVSTAGSKTVSSMKSELRAARTLGVIILFFFICFFPYYISSLIGQDMNIEAVLLFFSNSTINPIIYAFFYPWFRKTVKLLLSCKFCNL